jgi:Flp pilus assembly protein TadG
MRVGPYIPGDHEGGRRLRARGARSGAAAAELALVAPVLVFTTLIAADFARLFYYTVTITSCARNGALYGCLSTANSKNTSQIATAAKTDAGSISPTPSVSSSTGTDSNNDPYVAVTVTYTFNTIITYPGIPHTVTISRTVQMRVVQGQPS